MENDSVQFFLKAHLMVNGVFANALCTYIYLSNDGLALGEIKCDNISEIVMLQIFLVDLKELSIGAKYIVYRFQGCIFPFKNEFYKLFKFPSVWEGE